jgi:hypothetical protein
MMEVNQIEEYDVDYTLCLLLDRYKDLETERVKDLGDPASFKQVEEAIQTIQDYLGFYHIRSEYEDE